MTKSEIISRSLSSKDSSKLPHLLNEVWGHKTEESYWKWKYFRYPFNSKVIVFENRYGDIIGLIAFWIRPTKFGEQSYLPWMVTDVMAHPKFRHMGISQQFLEVFSDELRKEGSFFGFTNPISHNLFSKYQQEYVTVNCHLPILTTVIQAGKYVGKPKIVSSLLSKISRLVHKIRLQMGQNNNISIERCREIGDEFDTLWKYLSMEYFWIQNRGRKYLEWRYLSAPHREYQLWKARENGKLVGYLVTTVRKDSRMVKGLIVDWLVPRKRPDIFKAMVQHGMMWLIDQGVDIVETWLLPYEKEWRRILRTYFFQKNKRTQSFLLLMRGELKVENMFLTMGDSDQI